MQYILKQPISELVTRAIFSIILIMIAIITLYPFWYVLIASFSDPLEVVKTSGLMLWLKGFDLYSYKQVFENNLLWISYKNTIVYLILGVALQMVMTTLAAYALSRPWLIGGSLIIKFILFTMFFSGGLIPTYIVVSNLGMVDTMWSQFVPGAISVFNFILLRTTFLNLPLEMEEAATIDGASNLQILLNIVLPLSLPTLMVIGLYYAVAIWNQFFQALIYLHTETKFPLQMILRQILLQGQSGQGDMGFVNTTIDVTIKYATIIVSTAPILCVYPFIQKYFVKGVMIGGVKG